MALQAIMDAIAVRALSGLTAADATTNLPGLKACYSPGASTQGGNVIPRSIDDWPVGNVALGGGNLTAGNGPEPFLHDIDLDIWANATDAQYAHRVLLPFIERCRVLYRTDMDVNATAVRLQMMGYDPLTNQDAHGKPFLILTIRLQVLELLAVTTYNV